MKRVRELIRDFMDAHFGKILIIILLGLIIAYREPLYKLHNDWSEALRKEHLKE